MAKAKLLTDEWFAMVEKTNTNFGDLPLSPSMQKIFFNIFILQDDNDNNDRDKNDGTDITETAATTITKNKSIVNEGIHDVSRPTRCMRFAEGKIHLGEDSSAKTALSISATTLQKLLSTMKSSDAMQEFINGNIQITGDISQMMALQTAKMSDEQNALYASIIEHTEL